MKIKKKRRNVPHMEPPLSCAGSTGCAVLVPLKSEERPSEITEECEEIHLKSDL